MTYAEVLQRIIASKCSWEIEEGGMIIGRRADMPGKDFCPLTAVCFEFAGIFYKPSEVKSAAETIGMPPEFVALFADANDNLGMSAFSSFGEIGRAFLAQNGDPKTRRLLKIRADILQFTKLEKEEEERLVRRGARKIKSEQVGS